MILIKHGAAMSFAFKKELNELVILRRYMTNIGYTYDKVTTNL